MSEPVAGPIDYETTEEQIDSIYHELELARQWNRPSILFAIYSSSSVRQNAQNALEALIAKSGQDVVHYQVEYDEKINLPRFLTEISHKQSSVFYIDPLNSEEKNSQIDQLISILNTCKGYLIDHLVRVVFWLTEKEALSVAHLAPDFWASRHRVFEFVRERIMQESKPAIQANPKPVEGAKKAMIKTQIITADAHSGESMLAFDLSEGDEPSISGINLLLMLGVSSWKDGNLEKACEPLKTALAIAEKSGNRAHQAMCHKAIGLVKSDTGEVQEALQAYNQVVALGLADATIWNNIGSLSLKMSQYGDAQTAYKNALRAEAQDPVSWNGLGLAYAGNHEADDAVGCFRKAIQYNSGFVAPWVNLADVLSGQNRHEDALYAYMRTIEMDKKNVHAWSEIGSIYFKAGSFEQAIDAYRKAMLLGGESETLVANLAQAYLHAGYYPEAVSLFQKAIEQKQDEAEKAEMWNLLGDVYRRMNEYEKAVAAYEHADRLTTRVGDVLPAAAEELPLDVPETKAGVVAPSVVEIPAVKVAEPSTVKDGDQSSAPTTDPAMQENAQLWVRLGNTYLKAKATERAITAFRKAIDMDPVNGQIYYRLAELYKQRSEFGEAVSIYRKSADMLTDLKAKAVSFSQIGELQREMKEYANAMDAFETAIGFDPDNPEFLSGLEKIQVDLDHISGFSAMPVLVPDVEDELPPLPAAGNPSESAPPDGVTRPEAVRITSKSEELPEELATREAEKVGFPVNINLNNANVWNELGNIFTKSGSFDDAANAYNRAIELNPEFGWSYCNLALVYARQGKGVEAVALYQKSIELLGTEAEKAVAWNRLGEYYRTSGNYNAAIDAYQQADRLGHGNEATAIQEPISESQLFTHFVS